MMYGKILIYGQLEVVTGMHIGGSDAFSAIGAVDKPVIRDQLSNMPILPGSSLKGKLRTLLARSMSQNVSKMPDFSGDAPVVRRLFGVAGAQKEHTRLQFSDAFVCNADKFRDIGLTEIKAENSIDRTNSQANPRQIERVNRGVCFDIRIAYDIVNEAELREDFEALARAMKLLQYDYLGGHGTRGYGRVRFNGLRLMPLETSLEAAQLDELKDILEKGCAELELLRV
jgi:CRISPR-associated protein Csm3